MLFGVITSSSHCTATNMNMYILVLLTGFSAAFILYYYSFLALEQNKLFDSVKFIYDSENKDANNHPLPRSDYDDNYIVGACTDRHDVLCYIYFYSLYKEDRYLSINKFVKSEANNSTSPLYLFW